jgi:hypothetical protein
MRGSNKTIAQNILGGWFSCIGSQNRFIENVGPAVYFEGSNNIMYGNTINDILNMDGNGNIIAENSIKAGLVLLGYSYVVCKNNIKSGISVLSYNSTYCGNTIELEYPIVWRNDANNVFYHNNFYGDTEIRVWREEGMKRTYWDNGKVGNYWSSYVGLDLNFDGIGDTPYIVDADHIDRYPLMIPFNISSVPIELPKWALPPSVHLTSPKDTTYTSANVTLEFTVNKQTSLMGYSLDGRDNVTITGNTTLSGLSNGLHNVTVYARDEFENTGASETISFSIDVPFPATLVITSAAAVAIVGLVLLVYFKKRKS